MIYRASAEVILEAPTAAAGPDHPSQAAAGDPATTGDPVPAGDVAATGDSPPPVADPPAPGARYRRPVAVVENLLLAAGLLVLATTPKPPMMGDGLARYQALVQLLEQRQLPETPYSLIGPLFATPLWLVGHWYGNTQVWLAQYNLLLFVLGAGALHGLLQDRVDARLRRRFLLLLLAGSMVAAHVPDFYGEMFTAMAVGVGLLAATVTGTGRVTRAAGWGAVVLGVANTPASAVALAITVAVLCLHRRRVRYLLVLPATAALILGEAWWRWGDPLHSAYAENGGGVTVLPYSGRPGFSYPFVLGLVAILFSFGKGLAWFAPGLFLPVRRALRPSPVGDGGAALAADPERPDAAGRTGAGPGTADLWTAWLLWSAFVGGLVLTYASWWGWNGGMYWGPRFFLVAILPASLALAALHGPAARTGPLLTAATLVATALSVWGAANSRVFGQLRPWICYQDNYRLEGLCHFTPEFSPLWYPFVDPPTLAARDLLALGFYAVVLLWLTVPLLVRLARQVAPHARALGPRGWHW
ncbi:hypothetical protein AB0J86_28645 [Micromonospora sp. NPDC049559]|uniref:hypothetical protein n=1 Tax=Micromonospora sp. NPDC049559 TaxID=3155923 RepID=UPI00344201F9